MMDGTVIDGTVKVGLLGSVITGGVYTAGGVGRLSAVRASIPPARATQTTTTRMTISGV